MSQFLILIAAVILSPLGVFAQTVSPQAAAGGSYFDESIQMDWTIGEAFVSTLTNDNSIFTQGFQQPAEVTTSIFTAKRSSGGMKVFPNPAVAQLYFTLDDPDARPVRAELTDLSGRVLQMVPVPFAPQGGQYTVPLHGLSEGAYLLRVYPSGAGAPHTVMIQKQN